MPGYPEHRITEEVRDVLQLFFQVHHYRRYRLDSLDGYFRVYKMNCSKFENFHIYLGFLRRGRKIMPADAVHRQAL